MPSPPSSSRTRRKLLNHPAPDRLFLIGGRGSGKTSLARLLAERLGWSWVDADVLIEERAGRSIADIFKLDGEPVFRDLESAVLDDLCRLERHVIATGGGVVLRSANREKLRRSGVVVWLTAEPATLWRRVALDPTTAGRRPNLGVGGQAEIEEILRQREPLYRECAHHVVSTEGKSLEAAADVVLRIIRES